MPGKAYRMMREGEEEETLFDQETLLNNDVRFSPRSEWCHKFVKTIALSVAFLALGLCIAIPGPTLLDLSQRVKTDTEHISLIFTARSLGYLVGSVVGGFLFDRFDQQILLFYSLFLTAIATTVAPWCSTLTVLAIMISFQGLSMGVLDTGGNVFCIKIWGRKSGPYMQALHFAFGIGAFIAPLLARPFLANTDLLGANASHLTLSQGSIPILTKVPDLSKLGKSDNLGYRQSRQYRDLEDRLKRSETFDNMQLDMGNVTSNDSLGGNTTISTIPTTVVAFSNPLPKKPLAVDGKLLKKEYSDADKAKSSLIAHRKDLVTGDNDSKDTPSEKQTSSPSLMMSTPSGNGTQQGSSVNTTSVSNSTHFDNETINAEGTTVKELTSQVTDRVLSTSALTSESTAFPTTSTAGKSAPPPPSAATVPSPTKAQIVTLEESKATAVMETTTVVEQRANSSSGTNSTNGTKVITTEKPKKPETIGDILNSALNAVANMSKIQFAYLIITIPLVVSSFMFFALYCQDRNRSVAFGKDSEDDNIHGKDSTGFRIFMLVMLFIFFFIYVGMEVTYGGFLSTFSVEHLHWSKPQGATITAVFWGSLAAGRGFAVFVAKCFKPPCMLITDLVLVLLGAVILSFGIKSHDILLWAGTLIFGLGMSSIFPTGVSWADHYFPLTGKSTAVFVVGSSLGEMLVPLMTGYLYEIKDQMSLMYIMLALSIFSSIVFIIMQYIASTTPKISSMRNGFVPLQNVENISMDTVEPSYGSSGFAENSRKRQNVNEKPAGEDMECSRLVDIDD